MKLENELYKKVYKFIYGQNLMGVKSSVHSGQNNFRFSRSEEQRNYLQLKSKKLLSTQMILVMSEMITILAEEIINAVDRQHLFRQFF